MGATISQLRTQLKSEPKAESAPKPKPMCPNLLPGSRAQSSTQVRPLAHGEQAGEALLATYPPTTGVVMLPERCRPHVMLCLEHIHCFIRLHLPVASLCRGVELGLYYQFMKSAWCMYMYLWYDICVACGTCVVMYVLLLSRQWGWAAAWRRT